jgi:hypothetical protein
MLHNDITKLHRKTNRLLESDDKEDLLLAKSLIETKKSLVMIQLGTMGMDKPEKEEQNQDIMIDGLITKLGKSN